MKQERKSELHAVTTDGMFIGLNVHTLDGVYVSQFAGESETVLADRADELVCWDWEREIDLESIQEISIVWGNQTFGRNYRITFYDGYMADYRVSFDEDWNITSAEEYNRVIG